MIRIGQYYRAVVINEDGEPELFVCPWEFNHGAKLMEHSWLDSTFVHAFEGLLVAEAPRRVVWAGDYADAEVDENGHPRMMKSDQYSAGEGDANLYCLAGETLAPYRPDVPGLGEVSNYDWHTKAGKRRVKPKITYTRDPEIPPNAFPTIIVTRDSHPFLVNWDKREYVDKRKVERETSKYAGKDDRIHPLPLLTVEGNGRGGGDFHSSQFHGEGPDGLIGRWARDHISVHAELPSAAQEFDEIKFDLHEGN